jgi:hypothetical protein
MVRGRPTSMPFGLRLRPFADVDFTGARAVDLLMPSTSPTCFFLLAM